MTEVLGNTMGALISACYDLLHNYGLAIAAFTLLSKIILFPVSLWTQRNSLKMVALMPELNELKVKYYGDKDAIAEETQKMYKRVGYHPFLGFIPTIISLIILSGVSTALHDLIGGSGNILTLVPAQAGGPALVMPLLTGLAALALSLAQNHINALQREQSPQEKFMTNAVSVGISLSLGAFISIGTGVYWICGNLFSILNQLALNAVFPPEKFIDYPALRASQEKLEAIKNLTPKVSKEDRQREKTDYKRFFSVANKHLVFYSEKSGFYKYFKSIIEYLLSHSNVIIHYVTSDPKDQVFELAKKYPQIRPYYIGQKKIITLFMKMDADIVVMTTPDLDNYYLKRSYVRKDVEYIYLGHGVGSSNLTTNKGAYDHFDTLFVSSRYHLDEARETEALYGLPARNLVLYGSGLMDELLAAYEKTDKRPNNPPKLLIAPSWQVDNILDSCLDPMLEHLLAGGYDVTVRPHPEYVKRYPDRMEAIVARWQGKGGKRLHFETDFSTSVSIYSSDLLITDWSNINYEFSYCTKRPALYINTTMKVLNPDYVRYKTTPMDISMRDEIGRSLEPADMAQIGAAVEDLLHRKEEYAGKIETFMRGHLCNIGHSGEAGAKYILERLIKRQNDCV